MTNLEMTSIDDNSPSLNRCAAASSMSSTWSHLGMEVPSIHPGRRFRFAVVRGFVCGGGCCRSSILPVEPMDRALRYLGATAGGGPLPTAGPAERPARQRLGDRPCALLKALLNASSESYPTRRAIDATVTAVVASRSWATRMRHSFT